MDNNGIGRCFDQLPILIAALLKRALGQQLTVTRSAGGKRPVQLQTPVEQQGRGPDHPDGDHAIGRGEPPGNGAF
jgi:hypothetical protein